MIFVLNCVTHVTFLDLVIFGTVKLLRRAATIMYLVHIGPRMHYEINQARVANYSEMRAVKARQDRSDPAGQISRLNTYMSKALEVIQKT